MAIKASGPARPGYAARTGVVRAPCGCCLWPATSEQARLAPLPRRGTGGHAGLRTGPCRRWWHSSGFKEGRHEMLKETIAAMLVVTGMMVASARERDVIARFDGGIGVIPVTGGAGTPNADGTLPNVKLNVVRGVPPAGPWRIADLKAVVDVDGGISVKGKGL